MSLRHVAQRHCCVASKLVPAETRENKKVGSEWGYAWFFDLVLSFSFFLSLSLSASLHTQSHTFNIQRTYNEPKLNETRTVLLSCCTGGVSWAAVAVGCQPSSRLQRHLWQFGKSCRVSSGRRQVLVQVGSVCMVGTSIVVICLYGRYFHSCFLYGRYFHSCFLYGRYFHSCFLYGGCFQSIRLKSNNIGSCFSYHLIWHRDRARHLIMNAHSNSYLL